MSVLSLHRLFGERANARLRECRKQEATFCVVEAASNTRRSTTSLERRLNGKSCMHADKARVSEVALFRCSGVHEGFQQDAVRRRAKDLGLFDRQRGATSVDHMSAKICAQAAYIP